MSTNTYDKTGQIFFNLCQAAIVGSVAMIRTHEVFYGLHASVWLIVSASVMYITGWHFTDKASRLRRQEEKQRRK